MITIGEHKLNTRTPADLDDKLVEATGCNAAEHAAMLERGGGALQVAQALGPMLAEPLPLGDLVALIGESDVPSARAAVVTLLTPAPATPAKVEKAA